MTPTPPSTHPELESEVRVKERYQSPARGTRHRGWRGIAVGGDCGQACTALTIGSVNDRPASVLFSLSFLPGRVRVFLQIPPKSLVA